MLRLLTIYRYIRTGCIRGAVIMLLMGGVSFWVAPDWSWNVLVSVDQLGNTLLGGDPDETISSRLGKWTTGEVDWFRSITADVGCWFLDFFDDDHCVNSIDDGQGGRAVIE